MERTVSEEEFEKFVSEYPNKLAAGFYMDWFLYHDLSTGKIVAMKSDGTLGLPVVYKIFAEVEDEG